MEPEADLHDGSFSTDGLLDTGFHQTLTGEQAGPDAKYEMTMTEYPLTTGEAETPIPTKVYFKRRKGIWPMSETSFGILTQDEAVVGMLRRFGMLKGNTLVSEVYTKLGAYLRKRIGRSLGHQPSGIAKKKFDLAWELQDQLEALMDEELTISPVDTQAKEALRAKCLKLILAYQEKNNEDAVEFFNTGGELNRTLTDAMLLVERYEFPVNGISKRDQMRYESCARDAEDNQVFHYSGDAHGVKPGEVRNFLVAAQALSCGELNNQPAKVFRSRLWAVPNALMLDNLRKNLRHDAEHSTQTYQALQPYMEYLPKRLARSVVNLVTFPFRYLRDGVVELGSHLKKEWHAFRHVHLPAPRAKARLDAPEMPESLESDPVFDRATAALKADNEPRRASSRSVSRASQAAVHTPEAEMARVARETSESSQLAYAELLPQHPKTPLKHGDFLAMSLRVLRSAQRFLQTEAIRSPVVWGTMTATGMVSTGGYLLPGLVRFGLANSGSGGALAFANAVNVSTPMGGAPLWLAATSNFISESGIAYWASSPFRNSGPAEFLQEWEEYLTDPIMAADLMLTAMNIHESHFRKSVKNSQFRRDLAAANLNYGYFQLAWYSTPRNENFLGEIFKTAAEVVLTPLRLVASIGSAIAQRSLNPIRYELSRVAYFGKQMVHKGLDLVNETLRVAWHTTHFALRFPIAAVLKGASLVLGSVSAPFHRAGTRLLKSKNPVVRAFGGFSKYVLGSGHYAAKGLTYAKDKLLGFLNKRIFTPVERNVFSRASHAIGRWFHPRHPINATKTEIKTLQRRIKVYTKMAKANHRKVSSEEKAQALVYKEQAEAMLQTLENKLAFLKAQSSSRYPKETKEQMKARFVEQNAICGEKLEKIFQRSRASGQLKGSLRDSQTRSSAASPSAPTQRRSTLKERFRRRITRRTRETAPQGDCVSRITQQFTIPKATRPSRQ